MLPFRKVYKGIKPLDLMKTENLLPDEKFQVTIYPEKDLKDQILKIAKKERRNLSDQIVKILADYLEAKGAE